MSSPWYRVAPKIITDNSNVLFNTLEPNTLAIEIDTPLLPLLASIITEIFSGISPAKGLRITAMTAAVTPMPPANFSIECMKGSAHMKVPTVPIIKKRIALPPETSVNGFFSISIFLLFLDS